jgi:hypothetical protein
MWATWAPTCSFAAHGNGRDWEGGDLDLPTIEAFNNLHAGYRSRVEWGYHGGCTSNNFLKGVEYNIRLYLFCKSEKVEHDYK